MRSFANAQDDPLGYLELSQGLKRIIVYCLGSLLLAGCATVNVPNAGQQGYVIEEEEKRFFKRAQEIIELIDTSDYLYQDPSLETYLNNLANHLLPQEVRKDGVVVSIKVLKDPTFNAFAFPNGRIYVHLGILAAADNEAQLASLLGHEMTHVINRHQLRQFRSLTNKSAFFTVLNDIVAVGVGNVGVLATQLGALTSISGYSQNLEYEADQQGFQLMKERGYDIREAPKLFEHLEEFIKSEEEKQPFFFSSHPHVKARIKNFKDLIEGNQGEGGIPEPLMNTLQFQNMMVPVLLDQIQLCLQKGFFKTADKTVNKFISQNPQDKRGYFYLGELYRQRQDHDKKVKVRDKTPDYVKAHEAYDKALSLDATFPEAIKGKARILEKQGKLEEAKNFYQQYLQFNPQAPDRAYIEQFLSAH